MIKIILKYNKLSHAIEFHPQEQRLSHLKKVIYEQTHVLPSNQKLITKNNVWSGTIKSDTDLKSAQLNNNQQILIMGNIANNDNNIDINSSITSNSSNTSSKFPINDIYTRNIYSDLFMIFLTINTIAVYINHIEDTDETYGYWEPLHFLITGQGFQTWEYSPAYAIRTYSFIFPFYFISYFLLFCYDSLVYSCSIFSMSNLLPTFSLFYSVRFIIALFTSYCQSQYIIQCVYTLGYEIGCMTFLFVLVSPGIFYLSTSYLPSSIATSLIMLTFSSWLKENHYTESNSNNDNNNNNNNNNSSSSINSSSNNNNNSASSSDNGKGRTIRTPNFIPPSHVSVNYIWTLIFGSFTVLWTGWPFIGIILLPLGLHMLVDTYRSDSRRLSAVLKLAGMGIVIVACVVAPTIVIDGWMYGRR
jgi:hypothetical protein